MSFFSGNLRFHSILHVFKWNFIASTQINTRNKERQEDFIVDDHRHLLNLKVELHGHYDTTCVLRSYTIQYPPYTHKSPAIYLKLQTSKAVATHHGTLFQHASEQFLPKFTSLCKIERSVAAS